MAARRERVVVDAAMEGRTFSSSPTITGSTAASSTSSVVAGRRADWGDVDEPPLTPLLSAASVSVFGLSPQQTLP